MRISLLLPLTLLLLVSCDSGGQSESAESTKTKSTQSEPSLDAKAKPRKKAYTEDELTRPYSTVSPWRYLNTSPDTEYFKKMVTVSSHSRTIHSAGHALLIPRDQTFLENKTWKGIMKPENRDALDLFVGAHIIKGMKSPKEIGGLYKNLNGKSVTIENAENGEQVCGGARLLGQVIETDNGIVIPVMGMVEDIQWD